MIGTVGIGGVLLAPALILLLQFDVQLAIATSMWSFLFTGFMGAYSYHKQGSIDWSMAGWLVLSIIPASLYGARTNVSLPPQIIVGLLTAVTLYSAINVLWVRNRSADIRTQIAIPWLLLIGLIVGFGSALTGTGGAVILMPILLLLSIPTLKAVGVAQGIQLPIALSASIGFVLFGEVDYLLGTTLGVVQAIGVFIGAKIAHQLPTQKLRQVAGYALLLSAAMLVRQLVMG